MNTLNYHMPMLQVKGNKQATILLDELEFAMHDDQLDKITELHNAGMHFMDISKQVKRDPLEVIVALLHQVNTRVTMAPFAYIPKPATHEYKKGSRHRVIMRVDKVKKGMPSAVEINGRRYVYDPQN